MEIDRLIEFYHGLTPESVGRFAEFYAADAYFKDPFNEVHGIAGIQRVFRHMFRQVETPRFVVTGRVVDAQGAVLLWEFHFRVARWRRSDVQVIRGVSHLKWGVDGKVNYHRDYWDAAEELYMKLPLLNATMRGLRHLLAARD